MKFQFRYWNLGRKKKTAAKDKRRNGNNRHTKQSKRPNVNSSEATFTRNSNENAKMQANHSRNQNKKAAEVLTKKGLESKLRPMCQTSFSNKPWKIWKPIESEWLIEEILDAEKRCIWNLFLQLQRTQTKPVKLIWHSTDVVGPGYQNIAGIYHIRGQKKIAFSYSDPGGTLKKIKQPKTLSRKKEP